MSWCTHSHTSSVQTYIAVYGEAITISYCQMRQVKEVHRYLHMCVPGTQLEMVHYDSWCKEEAIEMCVAVYMGFVPNMATQGAPRHTTHTITIGYR